MKVQMFVVYAFAFAGMAFSSHEAAVFIERIQAHVMVDKYCSGEHLNYRLCESSRFIAQQN